MEAKISRNKLLMYWSCVLSCVKGTEYLRNVLGHFLEISIQQDRSESLLFADNADKASYTQRELQKYKY